MKKMLLNFRDRMFRLGEDDVTAELRGQEADGVA